MISAIHGFTGTPAVWDVLKAYDLMPQGLKVLGHGHLADGTETFTDEIERLERTLPDPCEHLLGYSLGARLALAIALRSPKKIGRLSLIGVHPGIEGECKRSERRQQDQRWASLLRRDGIHAFVESWEALPLWKTQRRLSSEVRKQQRQGRTSHDALQLGHSLQALGTGVMPPMWDGLSKLRLPIDLIVGGLDLKYVALAKRMMKRLPCAQLHVVDGAGHNVLLEAPDAVARILRIARTA